MTCVRLWTKTRASISWKLCCVKSEFQILYAVEQFSLLFSKDKLEQGAHIHQTHDLPSPRMSWENCRAVPCQQLPHVFCGAGTERTHLGRKGSFIHGFSPVTDRRLCHADEPQTAGETGVHGCHFLGCAYAWGNGQAVGWCMSAPGFNLLVTRDPPSSHMSW